MRKRIATAFVPYVHRKGGKRRPIFILRATEKNLYFFDITSKFSKKSPFMQDRYFEIQNYDSTGLKTHSWIDTFRLYYTAKTSTSLNPIGELSDEDTHRFMLFLKDAKAKSSK